MWKKIGMWIWAFLVFVVMLAGGSVTAKADGESLDSYIQGLNSPSEVYLDDASKPGGLGDIVSTGNSPLDYQYKAGTNYHLIYRFTLKSGAKITDGSYATVTLPEKNIDSNKMGFELTKSESDDTQVGYFEREKGSSTGKITFNKALANDDTFTQGILNVSVRGMYDDGEGAGGGKPNVVDKVGWVPDGQEYKNDKTEYPEETGWNIVFNYEENDMGNVTLVDTLGPYQTFVDKTFSATETKGDATTPIDFSYSQQVEITSNGSVKKIVFKKVTGKISLQYSATVAYQKLIDQGVLGGHLSNYVELTADNGASGSAGEVPGSGDDSGIPSITGKSHNDIPWGAAGSGTIDGSSFLGSMIFTKQDATDSDKTLKDANYTLWKKNDSSNDFTEVMNFSTDYLGEFTTNSLAAGTYYVRETKAPVGYQLNSEPSEKFTITSDNDGDHPQKIVQSDTPFKVTLTKKAKSTGVSLSGATYKLYYYDGILKPASSAVYKTDRNGQLTVSPIAKGSYEFIEQTAPTGYKKDDTPISFTISDSSSAQLTQPNGPEVNVSQEDESSVPTPNPNSGGGSSSSSSNSSSSSSSYSSSSNSGSSSASSSSHSSTVLKSSSVSSSAKHTANGQNDDADKVGSTPVVETSHSNRGGGAGAIATNDHGRQTRQHAADANRLLPKTNEGKTILAALGGLLLVGSSLSIWQYRRTRKN